MNPKKILVFIVFPCLLILNFSCSEEKDKSLDLSVEKDLVEKTINNSIGWAKNKDIKLLYSIISNDSSYIEVSPDGRTTFGFDNFKRNEAFWMNPEFKAIRYEIRDLRINFSASGEVAWFYCILDDINEWKGEPANWVNTRWTGVLEKRDGKWIMVQMHFSFASE
jgi:hypothetical protein